MAFVDRRMELLETLSSALREDQLSEKRQGGDRRPYECTQLLAPYNGKRMPNQAEFRRALCRDLSPSGFSYYADVPPEQAYVVVALGSVPFKMFVAEIVHVTAVTGVAGHGFSVGCRFDQRLS